MKDLNYSTRVLRTCQELHSRQGEPAISCEDPRFQGIHEIVDNRLEEGIMDGFWK